LIRQLLTESLLLAWAGGMLGLLLALWGVDLLIALSPSRILQAQPIHIDGAILGFTFVTTLLTGIVCGLAPAWLASQTQLHEALKEGGRGASDSPRRRRVRGSLVVAEVALALVLLVGAGLLIRSFRQLQAVDAGFDSRNLLTMQFSLDGLKYDDSTKIADGYRRLIEQLSALPGVKTAAAVSRMPLAGDRATSQVTIEGHSTRPGEKPEVHYRVATPGYFSAMEIPLRAGRNLTELDAEGQPRVVVINETLARRYWPNESPLGQRIRLGPNANAPWQTIVGVTSDARHFGLETEARSEVYVSYQQSPSERMRVIIRTTADPLSLVPGVRAAVKSFDQNLPFSQVTTMEQLYAKAVAQRRLNMWLLTILAGIALLLSACGIYGVMSYTVAERQREIGVRMALGGQRSDVLGLIFKQGMRLTLLGVLLGLTASVALTRLMETLLFGVSATDPLTFAAIALLLMLVALLACWIPARRATKVDPMIALRCE
jgi:putative ABC transport system permease protein